MPIENRRLAATVSVLLLLTGCGGEDDRPVNPHDSKFEAVTTEGRSAVECVRDSETGLTWEVKSDDPGLRDWRNTYSWFDPDEANKELDYRGLQDGGTCVASKCDTFDYVGTVNATGLCGYSDWRMPTRDELNSISDLTKAATPPTINRQAFPFAQPAEYWSANDYSFQYDAAWAWNFQYGHDRVDWKKTPKYLRLVRGEAAYLDAVKE